jgi:ribonucleoside-diphosphate reductase subunit M2
MQTQKMMDNFDNDEPLLNEANMRFTIFPIEYNDIWEMYKLQQASFWKAEEIDFSKDYHDSLTLTKDEQHYIKMILAFFASSDGIVNFNLRERFLNDIKIIEAQTVYAWQMMMENIHGEVYSKMLDNIIKDPIEKAHLFDAIETVPSVKKMANWAFEWIHSSSSFAHRVIAFAIVEGIFFSGAFASIFWLQKYRCHGTSFLQGLIKSNEFISRDEGMHTDFACLLYSHLKHKLKQSEVAIIMTNAVDISKEFMTDAIPCKFIGMNVDLMNTYIEYIADRLMVSLGHEKIYFSQNPFQFIETLGMQNKNNFFESRSTEYKLAMSNDKVFELLEDF